MIIKPMRLALGLIIMTLAGCSFISVDTEYDPAVNFAGYHTFKWMPQKDGTGGNPIVDSSLFTKRLQYAVDQKLAAKGYRKRPSGEADFLITYHISLKDKVKVADYGYRYGGWGRRLYPSARYGNYWGSPYSDPNVEVYQYVEARLVLDFVDSKSNELIWRGVATGVTRGAGVDETELNEAVEKMLKKFPPQ